MRMTELAAYCLGKPGAWEDRPWEGDVVAKVGPKVFAFLGAAGAAGAVGAVGAGAAGEGAVGVKCARTREEADEWLLRYPTDAQVMAYIGRFGWNTLRLGGAIPDEEILEAVDASYEDVVARLPRSQRPAG